MRQHIHPGVAVGGLVDIGLVDDEEDLYIEISLDPDSDEAKLGIETENPPLHRFCNALVYDLIPLSELDVRSWGGGG